MTSYDYHMVSRWVVEGDLEDVTDLFMSPELLPSWWPCAFLRVDVLQRGAQRNIGHVARLRVKGWLPHTLQFDARVEAVDADTWVVAAEGDFNGRCIASARKTGAVLEIVFDWKVRVAKPFVRTLSWPLKPLFIANHQWVMARGQQSLALELRRRRFLRQGRRPASVPPPPGPTFPHSRRKHVTPGRILRDFELFRSMWRNVIGQRSRSTGSAVPVLLDAGAQLEASFARRWGLP